VVLTQQFGVYYIGLLWCPHRVATWCVEAVNRQQQQHCVFICNHGFYQLSFTANLQLWSKVVLVTYVKSAVCYSQAPFVANLPAGNISLSAIIYFTGGHFLR